MLKRHATENLNQLEKDREPILITQHGVPSAYLVDVETFETLQRRMALLEGIARGEKAIDAIADYIALDDPEAARRLVQRSSSMSIILKTIETGLKVGKILDEF